jgi:hypothetical protein
MLVFHIRNLGWGHVLIARLLQAVLSAPLTAQGNFVCVLLMKRRICEVLGCSSYGSRGAEGASSHCDPNRISFSLVQLVASHVTTQNARCRKLP